MSQQHGFDPNETIIDSHVSFVPRPKTGLEEASQSLKGELDQLFTSLQRLNGLPAHITSHVLQNGVSVCGQATVIYFREEGDSDEIPTEYVVCMSLGKGGELTMNAALGVIDHPQLTKAGDVELARAAINRMIAFAETGNF